MKIRESEGKEERMLRSIGEGRESRYARARIGEGKTIYWRGKRAGVGGKGRVGKGSLDR